MTGLDVGAYGFAPGLPWEILRCHIQRARHAHWQPKTDGLLGSPVTGQ